MQKIITELKLSTGGLLEFMTLKLLSEKTYSIDELIETLKTVGFKTPHGSMYPLMSTLRRNGYETIEWPDC